MKFTKLVFLMVIIVGLLSACQEENKKEDIQLGQAPLEVELRTNPDAGLQVGEPIEILVEVTQDGEAVEEADEVLFEIWHEDEETTRDNQARTENEQGHAEDEHMDHESGQDMDEGHGDAPMGMADYETEHEMIEAENQGNGIYSIEYMFDKEGTYYVMYHVTAGGFHSMTSHELEVQP